jgi:hypothetical protein
MPVVKSPFQASDFSDLFIRGAVSCTTAVMLVAVVTRSYSMVHIYTYSTLPLQISQELYFKV